MSLRQTLGNAIDRVGTALNLPEGNLSEFLSGGKQTKYTGITPQSQNFGFVRNTGGDRALNIRSTNPQTMSQVQQQNARNIQGQPPAPAGTPSLADWAKRNPQATNNPQAQNPNAALGALGGVSSKSAEEIAQEKQNEDYKNRLGSQYGELRGKFGDLLGSFNEKLTSIPEQLRALNQQYKSVIGEQQNQAIGQIGQQRDKVAQQQKTGLAAIGEQVGQRIKQGAGRLGSLGMASSAAGMFQKAIQNEANKSAKDLLTQAANNYQQLDQEEARIKSGYKTMLDDIDAEEQNTIQDIQKNANQIIADINEQLRQSGELERIDKDTLRDIHLNALTDEFKAAKQNSEKMKSDLESWRRNTEQEIRGIKNQIVQDFIPREIQGRELEGVKQEQGQSMEDGLNPRLLRRSPEDNPAIISPTGLQQLTRRLRQNTNQ